MDASVISSLFPHDSVRQPSKIEIFLWYTKEDEQQKNHMYKMKKKVGNDSKKLC